MKAAEGPISLFCLHYLGGSAREFAAVADNLGGAYRTVPLDLPGFGEAGQASDFSVAAMADAVAAMIQAAGVGRWCLVGHSMGAKVAAVVASRVEQGAVSLPGLHGLVLLAGSPPAPEPMDDDKRHTLLSWFQGDASQTLTEAQLYLEQNTSEPLPRALRSQAIEDLQRMKRQAWVGWLTSGSREDWSDRVGLLRTPALLVAGADDESLGASAQRKLMQPHFANVELKILNGVTHLIPLEAAPATAKLIDDFGSAVRE